MIENIHYKLKYDMSVIVNKVASVFMEGILKLETHTFFNESTKSGCIATAFYVAYNPDNINKLTTWQAGPLICNWMTKMGLDNNFFQGVSYSFTPNLSQNENYQMGQSLRNRVLQKLAEIAYRPKNDIDPVTN